jgi:hypothetical protein
MEAILEGEAEALTRTAIELAKAGDTTALRLCLERLAPPRKDRPVRLTLPPLERPEDAMTATAALVQAVATGELTPSEAETVGKLLETHRRVTELVDFEARLTTVADRIGGESRPHLLLKKVEPPADRRPTQRGAGSHFR